MPFDAVKYLSERTRIKEVKRDGEVVAECPDCGRPDKLWMNRHTGLWICYKCGHGGDLVRLVSKLDGVSRSAAEAYLASAGAVCASPAAATASHLRASEEPPEEGPPEVEAEPELPAGFLPVYDPESRMRRWPKYLTERGVAVRTAVAYGLGVCQTGPCALRLVIPIRVRGELRSYTARTLVKGHEPKYWNLPDLRKSACLFGLDEAIGSRLCVLVEGPFDVFGVVRAGFSAVGILGKTLSAAQHGEMIRAGFQEIVTMLDPDAAAENRKTERTLATSFDRVRRAQLPAYDPADPARAKLDPGNAPPEWIRGAVAGAT